MPLPLPNLHAIAVSSFLSYSVNDVDLDEADGSSSDSDTASMTDIESLRSKMKELIEKMTKKRKREEDDSLVSAQKFNHTYFKLAGRKRVSKKKACIKGTSELMQGYYSTQWINDAANTTTGGSTLFHYHPDDNQK